MSVRNINNFNPILRKDFERFLTDTLRIGYLYLYNIIMKEEIWKDIQGYEQFYQISNFGNVKSLRHNLIMKLGKAEYLIATLCKYGKSKSFMVHRMTATAFIPNPENKPCINHLDGNKYNNKISNLEWVTYKENMKHAYDIGLYNGRDASCGNRRLTSKQVLKIRKLYTNKTENQESLCKMFKCTNQNISCIVNGKTWKHLL